MNALDVITGTVRSDLGASLRLALREERWFVVDLLGGVAGYAIWVAGTAALGLQVATLAEYQVAPAGGALAGGAPTGGTPTWPVLAVVLLLWIGLPALAGAAHLRSRVLNISGNVERVYRVDRPGTLLAAPVAVLFVLSLGTLVAGGPIAPLLAAALVPVTVYFLVRTTAYSYRVYAFSRPLVVHAATFATLAVQAGVGLAYLGLANGQRELVEGVASQLGLGMVFEDVNLFVTTAPYLMAMAVFVPVALGGAYLILQRVGVFLVRGREDSVPTGSLRTGQRYPPWCEGRPAGLTTSRRSSRGATDGAGASVTDGASATDGPGASVTNGGVASADAGGTGDSGGTAAGSGEATTNPATPESAESDADSPSDSGGSPEAIDGSSGSPESDDSTVENASHTRVYTPPKDELDDTPDPDDIGTARSEDVDDGAEADDEAGDESVTDESTEILDEETCWSCGATLPTDTDASYCPQCGERMG